VGGDTPAGSGGAPAVGEYPVGGGAQVVAPPIVAPPATVAPEAPKQRGPESPVIENEESVTIPVTTTTFEMPPPKKRGDGE
jgi:hypothetical protein